MQKTHSDWIVLYIKHKILRHKNKETFLHELVRLQWCRCWQMPVRHGEERAVDLSVDLHPYPHPFSQTLTLTERIRLWMQTTEMSFLQGVAVREQFPADWFFADLEYICTIIAKEKIKLFYLHLALTQTQNTNIWRCVRGMCGPLKSACASKLRTDCTDF